MQIDTGVVWKAGSKVSTSVRRSRRRSRGVDVLEVEGVCSRRRTRVCCRMRALSKTTNRQKEWTATTLTQAEDSA